MGWFGVLGCRAYPSYHGGEGWGTPWAPWVLGSEMKLGNLQDPSCCELLLHLQYIKMTLIRPHYKTWNKH